MIPTLDWLPAYRREWLRADVVAGLTTAAVVIPKSMAYATVAGLPIQVGLYTAFIPMLVYALLGTSRPLSVSTSTTLAILTAAQLAQVVPNGDPAALLHATAMLTAMVGGVLILASALRLGFVANFISEPVLGRLQGRHCGGDHRRPDSEDPRHPFREGHVRAQRDEDRTAASAPVRCDAGGWHRRRSSCSPRSSTFRPRWPAPLIAVAGAIAGAGLFAWQSYGIELVGAIPAGLPPFTLPTI